MGTEKEIISTDLMNDLNKFLTEIEEKNTVFFVKTRHKNWRDDNVFVLVPCDVGSSVLGLIDEEYGWPDTVFADQITSVWDLAPSYRKHPFITLNSKCVAVGIQIVEYNMIMEKIKISNKGD